MIFGFNLDLNNLVVGSVLGWFFVVVLLLKRFEFI